MHIHRHATLAIIFAAVLALSACGGGGDDTTPSPRTSSLDWPSVVS